MSSTLVEEDMALMKAQHCTCKLVLDAIVELLERDLDKCLRRQILLAYLAAWTLRIYEMSRTFCRTDRTILLADACEPVP